MYGKIKSAWKIEGDNFSYEIEIPANTKATVILPGKEKEPQPLGSGKYSFSYPAAGLKK
jgi:alpha-L-rhamnosidase